LRQWTLRLSGAHRLHRRSDYPTLVRFLHECDQAEIVNVGSEIEFQANILSKDLPLPECPNLHHASDYGDVRQCSAGIFAACDFRFRAVKSDGNVNVGGIYAEGFRQRISLEMSLHKICRANSN